MAKSSTSGQGRPKGSKNIHTANIKAMIEGALSEVGGQKYLEQQAIENPVAFMGLIGKILPKDVNLGGQNGNPVIAAVEWRIVDPKN